MAISRRDAMTMGAGTVALAVAGTAVPQASAAAGAGHRHLPSDQELARRLPGFRSRHARVNGIRLHYVVGGRGEPLVLVHGWPETWWEYRKVMPALADHFRVIAVDLRGIGGSDKPPSGYEKKNLARDIYELVRHLGYSQVNIAGHDIGSSVAFSLAVNHPDAVRRVALLSVLHPDESIYENRMLQRPGLGFNLWWHAFNQVEELPEQLLVGRARYLIDWMFDNSLFDLSAIGRRDRAIYAREYDHPAAIRGSNGWFQAWHQDVVDHKEYGPVTVPMLGLASFLTFDTLNEVMPTRGTDVRVELVEGAGHYLVEEQPAAVIDAFIRFFE